VSDLPPELFRYWRHSYEEDSTLSRVYRPDDHDFPVARWRDGFSIEPSGLFVQDSPHPADAGIVKQPGRWEAEGADRVRASVPGNERVLNVESVAEDELRIWPEHAVAGRYVFEVSYINFAWGYQHNGLFVDSTCGVYRYDYGPGDPVWMGGPDDTYSAEELATKYSPGRTYVGRVDIEELLAMQALVEPASRGEWAPGPQIPDLGTTSWGAYLFDPEAATHRYVALASDGGSPGTNLSDEARQLREWLERLSRRPGRATGDGQTGWPWELSTRDSLRAFFGHGHLVLVARGHFPTPGYQADIEQSPIDVFPPEFSVLRRRLPGAYPRVLAPFVHAEVFPLGARPDAVPVHHADGVDDVPVEELDDALPGCAAVLRGAAGVAAGAESVVGFSSTLSFDEAFADALGKLPPVSAPHPDALATVRVVDSGGMFGGIAGFHHLYVRVERTVG